METKDTEILELSMFAAKAADLAKESIEKYIEMHQEKGRQVGEGGAPLRMRLADNSEESLNSAVDASVKAAIENLQRYLDAKKTNE